MTAYTELEKQYIAASEAYALGEPIITDEAFDELEKRLRAEGSTLVNLVSEDFVNEGEEREVSFQTFSIQAVKTWNEVRGFFEAHKGCTFVAALKMDGVCTKLRIDQEGTIGQSRNRGSRTALDYTKAMNVLLGSPTSEETLSITGEAFVPWDDLETLREHYGQDKYVMPRSAAISLLRTPDVHAEEHIKLLKFRAFNTDKQFGTYAESLEWLESKGFEVPKYHVFTIDTDEGMIDQLTPIMDLIDTGEPSDGVVIQVNEQGANYKPEIDGKYMSTQIAVKLGKWQGKEYEAEVIGLNFGRAKGNKGVTLQIKPMRLEDNSTINKVNAYNIGTVHRMKIRKGSIVKFVRESNNMCNLVWK